VRTRVAPESVLHSIQKRIAAVNPDQQIGGQVKDLETWIHDEPVWATARLISMLFGGFSIFALAVSAIGIYSAVSYSAAQRTHEFGIRIALGAVRAHVWRIMLGSIVVSIGSGVVLGDALALALNRMAASWIAGYAPSTTMLLSGTFVLSIVSGAACSLPAWRASHVDPMTALRRE
jgi:putative ABC transport system permease protein